MEITRHNYEEYFLLYVDNELNAQERKAVEGFVEENPDLEEELVMLQQSVLRPDDKQVFIPKEYLLKDTSRQGLVNEGNYEEYFVLYGDDELTNEKKDLVEQFVYKFPRYQAEFELIQQARLYPENIHFADKQDLYRSEKDDNRVVPFGWWRMVAAAIVILTIGGLGLYLSDRELDDNKFIPVVKIDNGSKKSIPEQKTATTDQKEIVSSQNETISAAKETTSAAKEIIPARKETISSQPDAIHGKNETIVAVKRIIQQNSGGSSNISNLSDVQHTRGQEMANKQAQDNNIVSLAVKPVEVTVTNSDLVYNSHLGKKQISTPANATALAVATPQHAQAVAVSDESFESQASNHYVLNAPVNKTPLRGLFRKISRVVDKATTVEHDENGKGGVRIASFEIALK